jgi:Ca2+-binding RTX toxin-like protein
MRLLEQLWNHAHRSRGRVAARTRAQRRLHLEGLEDRALLTILFTPQNGAETANDGGGGRLGTVSPGMPLYSIFWGSYWTTSAGSALQSQIEDSLDYIFYFPPYLSGLHQYGVPNPAFLPGSGTYMVNNTSDPANSFSDSDVQNVIENAIANQNLPDSDSYSNEGLYLVFTPPGISYSDPNLAGYHGVSHFNEGLFGLDGDTRHYAWCGDPGTGGLPSYTYITSHEVMEAMTDPNGDAIQVLPRNSSAWNEICDNEAQNYTALINNYLVQSFWSQADNAYAVYDGNSEVVTDNNHNLYVNGDQAGPGTKDTVTVDLNQGGGVLVTLNGQTFSFPYGEINDVTINTGSGANTVNILNTTYTAPVSVVGDGADTINIGSGGSVQGIQGSISLENPPSFDTINIDDSNDPLGHTVWLNTYTPVGDTAWGTVYGLAPAEIAYRFSDTASVNVNLSYEDTVNVAATGVPVTLAGQTAETVTVGAGSNSVQSILGTVSIVNSSGQTSLTVNDSADSTARNVTLGTFTPPNDTAWSSIAGLAPANIDYRNSALASVTINGGTGGNTVDVQAVPSPAVLALNTGAGNDTLNLGPNVGRFNVDGGAGANNLVGPNANNAWAVTASNAGNVDSAGFSEFENLIGGAGNDTFSFAADDAITGSVSGGGGNDTLVGPNVGTVWNINAANAGIISGLVHFSGVANLVGGTANDDFLLGPNGSLSGTLTDSGGNGTVDYHTRTVGVTVNLGEGTATSIAGGVSGIEGVTGSTGNDSLTGDARTNYLSGFGGNDTLDGGGGGDDTFQVAANQGTGTTITGGPDTDSIQGPNVASTWILTGAGSGTINGVAFTGIDRFFGGSANDAFKFLPGGSLTTTINGGGGTNTLNYSGNGGVAVTVNLATGKATGIGGFAKIQSFVGSSATDTLIGPNATTTWTISRANAGSVGALGFSSFEDLTGGTGNDTFRFTATGSLSGSIVGGGGTTNKLDYSATSAGVTVNLQAGTATLIGGTFSGINAAAGSSGVDTLIGTNANTTWAITSLNGGQTGAFAFSGFEDLVGGAGRDIFKPSAGKGVTGTVDGGGGSNWLDMSLYTSAVTINLGAGTATNFGGLANINNARLGTGGGSLAGDAAGGILVGNTGADTIQGGSGRSILIGGKGADSVTGGSGDDVVIGGSTSYDANDVALEALLAEWQSADPYATRVSTMKSGVPGGYKLVFGTTVQDDATADTLTGGAGQDWFFQGTGDTITDLNSNETVN